MKNRSIDKLLQPLSTDEVTAARVCWYHYKEGLTQQATADRVGLSRATVNKIISDARAAGLVRVELNSPISACLELESGLEKAYGLNEVIVVPAPADEKDAYMVVGQAAGDYISEKLEKGEVLGMTWGSTLYFAAQSLEPRLGAGNTIVSLSGGLPKSAVINPYDNASMFARILDAECYYITAPMIVENRSIKEALLATESVKSVLAFAQKIDMALLTAVDLSVHSKIMEHGVLTEKMRKSLLKANSVGNVCDHYIDQDGELVEHPINDRTISAPLELVRAIPKRVLAGGGSYKVDILRACMLAKICNVLITEECAAEELLKAAP
jgi:DNA-binding transcriptional regulator LsrR (DeoR family)